MKTQKKYWDKFQIYNRGNMFERFATWLRKKRKIKIIEKEVENAPK